MPTRAERDAARRPATGQARQAKTAHGFPGIEKQAVGAIMKFIRSGV